VTVFENGEQRMLPSGAPELRVCFAPRDTITILDNWDVVGMFATGSYDYEVAEQFFPVDMSMERSVTVPKRGGSLFNIGLIGIAYLGHAAVALGLMKRALEEVADIAATKTRAGYTGTFSNDPVFRREFAIMEAQYQAARSYVRDVFDDAYASAQAGTAITAEQRGRFKQSTVWAHDIGMKVVQFCNTWGGSQALRHPSVLGRCLRDMSVATQHIFVDQNHYTDAGTALVAAYVGRNAAVAAKP
jgi:alkylation response protein AidB-like acyl-CoA dehydrogenase